MALLHCYRFIYIDPFETLLTRVNMQLRGVCDPLVATYARAYLARVGVRLKPRLKPYLVTGFVDHLDVMKQNIEGGLISRICTQRNIDPLKYYDLYSPALDWMLQCLAHCNTSHATLTMLLQRYQQMGDALTLNHIIRNFHPSVAASNCETFCDLIRKADDKGFRRDRLWATLGTALIMAPPPQSSVGRLWKEVWSTIVANAGSPTSVAPTPSTAPPPAEDQAQLTAFVNLCEIWVEFPVRCVSSSSSCSCCCCCCFCCCVCVCVCAWLRSMAVWVCLCSVLYVLSVFSHLLPTCDLLHRYMTVADVSAMLAGLLERVKTPGKFYTQVFDQLQSIVQKVLSGYPDFTYVSKMDKLHELLDLFTGEHQTQVHKAVLRSFRALPADAPPVSDPVLIEHVFTAAKTVHDSINSLSFEDERRQVSELLCAFISKVDYGRQVEKQLTFLSDARRAFGNFDSVKARLVLCVAALVMRTLALAGGKHTQQTTPFVRACVAFLYITIPSIESAFLRLDLYIVSANVALQNGAVGQAEDLLK